MTGIYLMEHPAVEIVGPWPVRIDMGTLYQGNDFNRGPNRRLDMAWVGTRRDRPGRLLITSITVSLEHGRSTVTEDIYVSPAPPVDQCSKSFMERALEIYFKRDHLRAPLTEEEALACQLSAALLGGGAHG